ncbi:hypothetical protein KKG41_01020 [Patescibacteria group bacterium]|nr:hypothetical protein [Patescibacteria group bacterium]MBU1890285.1 hypothetical protein [Patescibacteria group bacterium]
MKKLIYIIILFFVVVLTPFDSVDASEWTQGNDYYMAGDCYMVDTPAEADATHVYTLNPDHTNNLNQAYYNNWQRQARCDELQFHVDHNTTLTRLNTWLREIAIGWYQNIGGSHFEGQTVSTSRHEYFLVQNGVIRRIPDWLTAMSWGLLVKDRLSIPYAHTEVFYSSISLGTPLPYSEGNFVDDMNSIWQEGSRDFSDLPERLGDEIDFFARYRSSGGMVFANCAFAYPTAYPGNPHSDLFAWDWMHLNPGCSLSDVPTNSFEEISFTADSEVLGETSSYTFMVTIGEDIDTGGAFDIGFESFGTCSSDDADDCIVNFNGSRKGTTDITAPLSIHNKTAFSYFFEEATADTHSVTIHGIVNPTVSSGPYRAYLEFADGSEVPPYTHNRIYSEPFNFAVSS